MSSIMLSVFTDEISQDFDHACHIAANEFGTDAVELRKLWDKNIMALDAREIADARKILEKYGLRVSQIGAPLYKVDWPGAPLSKHSPNRDKFSDDYTFAQQPEVLERGLELAKVFKTERLRCFDFWRLDDKDRAVHRPAIIDTIRKAAETCGKHKIILSMENEYACNTANAHEGAEILAAIKSPWYRLNWDPGNAAFVDEVPYPDGYNVLPKGRLGNCHCKDAIKNDKSAHEWQAVGRGTIDFVGMFKAMKKDGYHGPVTLETHWRGAGTPEESSRQSMAGLKASLKQAGLI